MIIIHNYLHRIHLMTSIDARIALKFALVTRPFSGFLEFYRDQSFTETMDV